MFNLLNNLFAATLTIAIMFFMVYAFGKLLGIGILAVLVIAQQVGYRLVKGYWQPS